MLVPENIYLYRITHLNNLDYIIKTGKITCPNHPDADSDYINIGDTTLIRSRNNYLRTRIQQLDSTGKKGKKTYSGVRYSLENPQAYINSNIVGFINILETCH